MSSRRHHWRHSPLGLVDDAIDDLCAHHLDEDMNWNGYESLESVVLSVVANGLTAFLAKLGSGLYQDVSVSPDDSLNATLAKAAAFVAEEYDLNDESRVEEICLFLFSAEAQSTIRQLFASAVVESHASVAQIRSSFVKRLSYFLGVKEAEIRILAEELFEAMRQSAEAFLQIAIARGQLIGLDAKSNFRHKVLMDELQSIQKQLDYFRRGRRLPLRSIIADFEPKWREQVAQRHGYITPPHLNEARKFPIDEIYVKPKFIRGNKGAEKGAEDVEDGEVSFSDFLRTAHRCVILGNPGGGKSTFASKLCFDLASRHSEKLYAHRELTPIHVVLRDYGAARQEKSVSILEFINSTSNSKYQIKAPDKAFEYLLLNGRALVIFDGLDELLDTSVRREISDDVESFCNLYPETPVIVTSREVGYAEAPLDPRRFREVRLGELNDAQVKSYVTNWFAIDTELTDSQKESRVRTFARIR